MKTTQEIRRALQEADIGDARAVSDAVEDTLRILDALESRIDRIENSHGQSPLRWVGSDES